MKPGTVIRLRNTNVSRSHGLLRGICNIQWLAGITQVARRTGTASTNTPAYDVCSTAPSSQIETPIARLVANWNNRSQELAPYSEAAAVAWRRATEELAECLAEEGNCLLSVAEAALLSGRHRDTIGNALKNGTLRNHGKPFRPLVMSSYPAIARPMSAGYDDTTDARAFLGARRGEN